MLIEPLLGSFVEESAFGAYGAGLLADEIAAHDSRGFGALVARALEPVDGRS
jgi:hypothetical protein